MTRAARCRSTSTTGSSPATGATAPPPRAVIADVSAGRRDDGRRGPLLARRDDASTWMEVYEPVRRAGRIRAGAGASRARHGAEALAERGVRKIERFVRAPPHRPCRTAPPPPQRHRRAEPSDVPRGGRAAGAPALRGRHRRQSRRVPRPTRCRRRVVGRRLARRARPRGRRHLARRDARRPLGAADQRPRTARHDPGAPSRGALVPRVLAGDGRPATRSPRRSPRRATTTASTSWPATPRAAHWGSNRAAAPTTPCARRPRAVQRRTRHAVAQGRAHQGGARGLVRPGSADTSTAVRAARATSASPPTTSCRRPACRWTGSGGCRRRSSSATATGRAARRC